MRLAGSRSPSVPERDRDWGCFGEVLDNLTVLSLIAEQDYDLECSRVDDSHEVHLRTSLLSIVLIYPKSIGPSFGMFGCVELAQASFEIDCCLSFAAIDDDSPWDVTIGRSMTRLCTAAD